MAGLGSRGRGQAGQWQEGQHPQRMGRRAMEDRESRAGAPHPAGLAQPVSTHACMLGKVFRVTVMSGTAMEERGAEGQLHWSRYTGRGNQQLLLPPPRKSGSLGPPPQKERGRQGRVSRDRVLFPTPPAARQLLKQLKTQ